MNPGRCKKENFCISGVDDLIPNEPTVTLEGDEEYTFNKHKGGSIKFTENPNDPGLWTYPMYDTDFNREILASHYYLGYWEINDAELDATIRKRADEMAEQVKKDTGLTVEDLKKKLEALDDTPQNADKVKVLRDKVDSMILSKRLADLNLEYKVAKKDDQQKILDQIQQLINDNANEVLKPKLRAEADKVVRKRSRIRIPKLKKPEPIKAEVVEGEEKVDDKPEAKQKDKKVDETPYQTYQKSLKEAKEAKSTELVKVDEQ